MESLRDVVYLQVVETLQDADYRGGPLQRQYPAAVIKAIAEVVADKAADWLAERDEARS